MILSLTLSLSLTLTGFVRRSLLIFLYSIGLPVLITFLCGYPLRILGLRSRLHLILLASLVRFGGQGIAAEEGCDERKQGDECSSFHSITLC